MRTYLSSSLGMTPRSSRLVRLMAAVGVLTLAVSVRGCSALPSPLEEITPRCSVRAHAQPILGVAVGSGTSFVTASADRTAAVWDAQTCENVALLSGHSDWVTGAAFSPDGRQLATSGKDGEVALWDTETWTTRRVLIREDRPLWGVAYSPLGDTLATASEDGTASIWDASDGARLLTLQPDAQRIVSLTYSTDGTRIMTSHGGSRPEDRVAIVWNARTGEQLIVLQGHMSYAEALASRDPDEGAAMISAGITDGNVTSAGFSQDGSRIATAGDDGTVRLWDAVTGAQLTEFHTDGGIVYVVRFSPDGKLLFGGGSLGAGLLWGTESRQVMLSLPRQDADMKDAAFGSDGTSLVTAYYSGTATVWDVPTH